MTEALKDTEENRETKPSRLSKGTKQAILIGAIAVVAAALIVFFFSRPGSTSGEENKEVAETHRDEHGESGAHEEEQGSVVELSPEAAQAASLEIEAVTERPAIALLRVTGTVELNPHNTQEVTPLVGGRVERVNVALGDRIKKGDVLAVIASPDIARMHGKLHEAETKLESAERNLSRVQRAENRVAVLSAKAKLDEAEATLKRTKRLIELGAGAGKDLIAAEAAYRTAKAEYEFQSNISLNKEIQEARAEVEASRVDVSHIRDEMRALNAPVPTPGHDTHDGRTANVPVHAPVSGIVTERKVNAGAGIQAGESLFIISNLSSVYIIANVPEALVGHLREGTPAEIRSAAMGANGIRGQVSYIDPRLDENTRTARTRIEVVNPGERLKAGMFVEVGFQAGGGLGETELMVPSAAVQRVGERTVVFVPKDEPNHFEVKDVEVGGVVEGYRKVIAGLELGEQVVTKGSFTLKTQLLKGEIGEDHH